MQDIILLKQGEIVLKGLNKKYFEQKLISNVKRRLRSLGEFDVTCTQSTIYVEPKSDDIDMDETQQAMTKVFGNEKKCTGIICTPRLAIIYVDTGESMPPESSVTAVPPQPTGRPPAPGSGGRWM